MPKAGFYYAKKLTMRNFKVLAIAPDDYAKKSAIKS